MPPPQRAERGSQQEMVSAIKKAPPFKIHKKDFKQKRRISSKKERFRAEKDFDPTNTKAFSSSFHSEK